MRTSEKIKGAKLEDLLKLLETRLDLTKPKIVTVQKDDYPDGVKRTIKNSNELRGGRSGNRLLYHERYYTSLLPGKVDPTAEQVVETGGVSFAVTFTGYQFDGYVLLEIECTETWQEPITSMLSDLPRLDEDAKNKTVTKEWKKLSTQTQAAYTEAWNIYITLQRNYQKAYLDGSAETSKVSLSDWRAAIVKKGVKVGTTDRTLQTIKAYGDAEEIPKKNRKK
jgi:hypothetical protein